MGVSIGVECVHGVLYMDFNTLTTQILEYLPQHKKPTPHRRVPAFILLECLVGNNQLSILIKHVNPLDIQCHFNCVSGLCRCTWVYTGHHLLAGA